MKWSDFFKKLGINMDEEMDDASTETVKVDKEVKKENVKVPAKEPEVKVENVTEKNVEVKKMVLPKYDEKTGLFTGLSDLDNEELKTLLKSVNTSVKAKADTALIEKAISDKLGTVKLANGISNKVVLNQLDRADIKVTDGVVTGVEEAFKSLMTSESGLFVADKETSKSNPMLEGFNPQNTTQQGVVPNSFVEAFSMME